MLRVTADRQGPPQVLRLEQVDEPQPAAGQVLVEVAAAGVNFVDLHQRSGAYTVDLPWYPGFEGSGTVLRVGAQVSGVRVGDRVAWSGGAGAYATHCLVPAERVVTVPAGVPLADAAAVLVQGMTAHLLATDVVPLAKGDVCLVHAAAGGVGGLLCQLAAARGATVIGTVSDPAKVEPARAAGARHVIDYRRENFRERVLELTDGRGVDVVYDAVGRDTFDDGLACLRRRGTFVLYGQISGQAPAVEPQTLNRLGSLFLTKVSLGHYDTTREQTLRRAGRVFDELLAGRLRPRVHATLPLAEAAVAHEVVESRRAVGKVLLRP